MVSQPIPPKDTFAPLPFPLRGIDISQAFGQQPQGTTPIGQNVRAYEAGTARARGGQRPGLARYINATVFGTSAIQELNYVVGTGYTPPGS